MPRRLTVRDGVTQEVEVPISERVRRGVWRRIRDRIVSKDERVRTIPVGLARGIRFNIAILGGNRKYVGLFEYEIADYIRAVCQPGAVCWDIGGADGFYALIFAKLTGARVASFEADPKRCEDLRRSCQMNPDLAPLIEVHQAFVGTDIRLDDFRKTGSPDVLKIDIEENELEVLEGASSVLEEDQPAILMETHSGTGEDACAALLLEKGYTVRIVTQRRRFREDRPLLHNRWMIATAR